MYVLDTESLILLRAQAHEERVYDLLDAVSDLVLAGEVTFPDAVAKECRRLADREHASWIKALLGSRHSVAVPYERVMEVLGDCPDVMDFDSPIDEPSQIYVVAIAYEIRLKGLPVIIVTDDELELPDRMPLATVCKEVNIERCSLREFLRKTELDGFT